MSRNWMIVSAVALSVYATAGSVPAAAGEPRFSLALSGKEAGAGLSVEGSSGAYAVGNTTLELKLDFSAAPQSSADAWRLITSRVFLKAEGPDRGKSVEALSAGSRSASVSEHFSFTIDPLGPIAQNAKAACAAQGAAPARMREVAMLVPIVWRVTTGAFAFARLAAAGLQPDEAMFWDAAYYGETASEDTEVAIAVKVLCRDVEAAALTPRVARAEPESNGRPSKPQPSGGALPDKRRAVTLEPVAAVAAANPPVGAQAAPAANALRCEGGIVRETLAGPGHDVCLCPGNTARQQMGERSYVCEKRLARVR